MFNIETRSVCHSIGWDGSIWHRLPHKLCKSSFLSDTS